LYTGLLMYGKPDAAEPHKTGLPARLCAGVIPARAQYQQNTSGEGLI